MAGDSTSAAERWRDVPGFEGLYQVSDWGRVRSLDRVVVDSLGRQRLIRGRLLKPISLNGYHYVGLFRDGEQTRCLVHRLVLLAFVGEPESGQECRHLNGDPANNRLENLAWGRKLMGENHGRAKLTEADVLAIRAMAGDYSQRALGRMFSVSQMQIWQIIRRKLWAHLDEAVDD